MKFVRNIGVAASTLWLTAYAHATSETSTLVDMSAWTEIKGLFTGPVAAVLLFIAIIGFFIGMVNSNTNTGKLAMLVGGGIGLVSASKLVSGLFNFPI